MIKAYLVGFLNKKVSPPVLEGVGIYSAPSGNLTYALHKHFLFDITNASGQTIEEARERLMAYTREFHPWAIPFIR